MLGLEARVEAEPALACRAPGFAQETRLDRPEELGLSVHHCSIQVAFSSQALKKKRERKYYACSPDEPSLPVLGLLP
jgi:hypothetical protein